jgi:hypothetical protein
MPNNTTASTATEVLVIFIEFSKRPTISTINQHGPRWRFYHWRAAKVAYSLNRHVVPFTNYGN